MRRWCEVVSWNLNGIRAAYKKGLDPFIRKLDADVLLSKKSGASRADA